jgi:phage antirepressor YoqD-like protein
MNQVALPEKTMSSREIAELTGKEHRNVMRDIRTMLVELYGEDRMLTFEQTVERPNPSGGAPIRSPVFMLPKRESLILVSGYSVPLRAKIIDRWEELEREKRQGGIQLDLTDPASLRAFSAQLLLDKADLIERIREAQPKADAFERLAKAEGLVTFTDAAKLTGVPRGDLIELAFSLSWVYRDRATGDIYPYAAVTDVRMEAPLMTLRTLNVGTAEKPKMKKWAYLTARGLARLAELVKRERSALVAMPH